MELRDSGMPEDADSELLPQPEADLDRLGLGDVPGDAAGLAGATGLCRCR